MFVTFHSILCHFAYLYTDDDIHNIVVSQWEAKKLGEPWCTPSFLFCKEKLNSRQRSDLQAGVEQGGPCGAYFTGADRGKDAKMAGRYGPHPNFRPGRGTFAKGRLAACHAKCLGAA